MSAIASWARRRWLELSWLAFAAANLLVLLDTGDYETVPFHFVWVSLTIVYGFRVWRLRTTMLTLAGVCVATGVSLGWVVTKGPQGPDELTEVPLMATMFLAMVWHARRRQAALEEASRAAQREREFVRDASHQLKTPIAIARGMADLVRGATPPSELEHDLGELVDELDHLGSITDDLLLLASAEQQGALACAPVEFEDLIVGVVRRWSRRRPARAWQVDVQAEGTVVADRTRLESALDAVLENAVAATRDGDVIAIVGRASGPDARIDVSDAGIGIPFELQERIFDRFFTVRSGTAEHRGTGLGLAIVKATTEAHGGWVSVRSVPRRGTTISLSLPGFRAAPPDDDDALPPDEQLVVGT